MMRNFFQVLIKRKLKTNAKSTKKKHHFEWLNSSQVHCFDIEKHYSGIYAENPKRPEPTPQTNVTFGVTQNDNFGLER